MRRCEVHEEPPRPNLQELNHFLCVVTGGVFDDQVQHLVLRRSAIYQIEKLAVFLLAVPIGEGANHIA